MFAEARERVQNHPLINNNEYDLLIDKTPNERSDKLNQMFLGVEEEVLDSNQGVINNNGMQSGDDVETNVKKSDNVVKMEGDNQPQDFLDNIDETINQEKDLNKGNTEDAKEKRKQAYEEKRKQLLENNNEQNLDK